MSESGIWTDAHQEWFIQTLGLENVRVALPDRKVYARDYTEDLEFLPDIVLLPDSVEDVSAILSYCNQHHIPVTPRGAGTGLSGGCLPVFGGVGLSMERFNRILNVDTSSLQATVEPGVINQVFRDHVEAIDLFYPPDPASRGSCFLGGNVAHNSGGPKAVKYGVTRDYILNLEVVLADGSVIWTGADTLKYSTGYNLTQLMIGSEGTLGVVTKIVVRLLAKPKADLLMLAQFDDAVQACEAVADIMKSGITPSAMELMEQSGVHIACDHLQLANPTIHNAEALLLIELDGKALDDLYPDAESIYAMLENHRVLEVQLADTAEQKDRWWRIRKSIGEVVKAKSVYKEEDTVVKRAELPRLMTGVKEIGRKYGFESVCYGHAGDGNLHVNILKNDMSDEEWNGPHLESGIRELFRLCKELGGTISGEHGIGYVQRKYMTEVLSEKQLDLMRLIKKSFDPNGILNPGKIF
ncbi:MAG: FAD-binding protein [Flavobacteriales bacterium]|nr:FAD-binding protein [Bacteroidota bacterium]MCB9239831.1 FAD-binding protein [Flavobacteriales bacterium]